MNFYTLIVPVETFLHNVIRSLSNGYFVSSIFTMVHVRVPQSESNGKVETWKQVNLRNHRKKGSLVVGDKT